MVIAYATASNASWRPFDAAVNGVDTKSEQHAIRPSFQPVRAGGGSSTDRQR